MARVGGSAAIEFGDKVEDRVTAAGSSGETLRAFGAATDEQRLHPDLDRLREHDLRGR